VAITRSTDAESTGPPAAEADADPDDAEADAEADAGDDAEDDADEGAADDAGADDVSAAVPPPDDDEHPAATSRAAMVTAGSVARLMPRALPAPRRSATSRWLGSVRWRASRPTWCSRAPA
jgi:hypothetical protein